MLWLCYVYTEALVSPDTTESMAQEMRTALHNVANGDMTESLARVHIQDWHRRMKSLKHLQIDERLEVNWLYFSDTNTAPSRRLTHAI